jgi:hypothetical protein
MRYINNFKKIFLFVIFVAISVFSIWLYMNRIRIEMNTKTDLPQWESVSASQWQALSQKKIFFAHMSVGNNILDGAQAVLQRHPGVSLVVTRASNPADMNLPALYHSEELGHNAEPFLKIEAFRSLLNRIQPAAPDMVLMKFCYVDVQSETDTDALFKAYDQTISELKTQMPNTLFLHGTIPLESPQLSMKRKCKEIIKSFLGRPTRSDNNYKRMLFNQKLKSAWPAEQVFDIAQIESATPEGFLSYKVQSGQKIPFLYGNYTTDGGHLNDVGAQRIGEQFLIFLAKAACGGVDN